MRTHARTPAHAQPIAQPLLPPEQLSICTPSGAPCRVALVSERILRDERLLRDHNTRNLAYNRYGNPRLHSLNKSQAIHRRMRLLTTPER